VASADATIKRIELVDPADLLQRPQTLLEPVFAEYPALIADLVPVGAYTSVAITGAAGARASVRVFA
jgi:hypothetical protein